jgi:hypothetical protein
LRFRIQYRSTTSGVTSVRRSSIALLQAFLEQAARRLT